jgi:hypothetical protein
MKRALLLLLLASCAMAASSWRYYPANTQDGRGITLYFEGLSGKAEVTIEAIYQGKATTKTQTVDARATAQFISMDIDPDHQHELVRVTIRLSDAVYAFERPRSGRAYDIGGSL